jgi:hypothetical protein
MTCGVKMRMAGSCFVCEGCGNTSGCSWSEQTALSLIMFQGGAQF